MALSSTLAESAVLARPSSAPWRVAYGFLRFARRKPLGALGALIIVVLVLTASAAPTVARKDPLQFNGIQRLKGPSLDHWFGTDNVGRDVFARIVYGTRVSVTVAFGAIAINVALALIIALSCGYFGGWFDSIVQRFVDACMAFPWLIVLITLVAVFGSGLVQVVIALGALGSFGMSRVIRSTVFGVKAQPYFEAAVVSGASGWRIVLFHVLPNVFAPVIISASVSMGGLVLAEASLSFLGFGVPPPTPSWGSMLSVEGRAFMERAPWLAIFPGLAIASVVFSFNMLGDAIRDLLDPRLRMRGP
jgi:peptide/nickel transport system permease protein